MFPNSTMLMAGARPRTRGPAAAASRPRPRPARSGGGQRDLRVVQQRGPDFLPGGQVGAERGPVRGGPVGSTTRTVIRGPEPKDARTAGAQAVARLLPNRSRTAGVSRRRRKVTGSASRPEHEQFARGKPVRPERSAHHRVAGHRDVLADLLGNPDGGLMAGHRPGARAAALGGSRGWRAAKILDPRDPQRPRRRGRPARRPGEPQPAATGSSAPPGRR